MSQNARFELEKSPKWRVRNGDVLLQELVGNADPQASDRRAQKLHSDRALRRFTDTCTFK